MLLVQSQAYRQEFGFDASNVLVVNLYGPDNFRSGERTSPLIRSVGRSVGRQTIEIWGGGATPGFLYVGAARGVVAALGSGAGQ
jgi:GDP-L-fucose synthase